MADTQPTEKSVEDKEKPTESVSSPLPLAEKGSHDGTETTLSDAKNDNTGDASVASSQENSAEQPVSSTDPSQSVSPHQPSAEEQIDESAKTASNLQVTTSPVLQSIASKVTEEQTSVEPASTIPPSSECSQLSGEASELPSTIAQTSEASELPLTSAHAQTSKESELPSTSAQAQTSLESGLPSTSVHAQTSKESGLPSTSAHQTSKESALPSTSAHAQTTKESALPSTSAHQTSKESELPSTSAHVESSKESVSQIAIKQEHFNPIDASQCHQMPSNNEVLVTQKIAIVPRLSDQATLVKTAASSVIQPINVQSVTVPSSNGTLATSASSPTLAATSTSHPKITNVISLSPASSMPNFNTVNVIRPYINPANSSATRATRPMIINTSQNTSPVIANIGGKFFLMPQGSVAVPQTMNTQQGVPVLNNGILIPVQNSATTVAAPIMTGSLPQSMQPILSIPRLPSSVTSSVLKTQSKSRTKCELPPIPIKIGQYPDAPHIDDTPSATSEPGTATCTSSKRISPRKEARRAVKRLVHETILEEDGDVASKRSKSGASKRSKSDLELTPHGDKDVDDEEAVEDSEESDQDEVRTEKEEADVKKTTQHKNSLQPCEKSILKKRTTVRRKRDSCAVLNCGTSRVMFPGLKFYRFPNETKR